MDLPTDLNLYIVSFFPVRDLLMLRLISNPFREACKEYDKNIVTSVPKHSRWRRTFPKAHFLLPIQINITEDQFNDYIKLENLTIHCPIQKDAFLQTPHLKRLEIWSWSCSSKCDTTLFRPLHQLHTLKIFSHDITDESLSYLPQLKHLGLDHCKRVTSVGIRQLTQLTTLHLHAQHLVTDTAFEGILLEELYVHTNDSITDQGILTLHRLKKLTTCKTPNIRGVGFHTLGQLRSVYLHGATISSNYSDFKHIRFLIFNHCILPSPHYERWNSIRTLQIYNSYIVYPSSLFQVSNLPYLKQFIIEHCPSMAVHEETMRTYFGSKLLCKHLNYLTPY
jgi:Leucine-rich repeat (LRR) protein